MTVTTTNSSQTFQGNGTAKAFPCAFAIFQNTDVDVFFVNPITAAQMPALLNSDYTITGAGASNGFTVNTTVPVPAGTNLFVERVLPYTQPTDFTNQGDFFPTLHQAAIDRLCMLIQQVANQAGLNITLPPGIYPEPSSLFPLPSASALIGWNPAANALQNYPIPDFGTGTYAPGFPNAVASRAIASKLREMPSTADFGCAGDGVTDDTAAFQAAINSGVGAIRVIGTIRVTSTITLVSGCYIHLPVGTSVKWGGASGGTVFASPAASVLIRAGIICDGGYIDVGGANVGMYLHSHQCCQFKWESVDHTNNANLTVIKNVADSTSSAGSLYGGANTARNVWYRIYHSGIHGTLMYVSGGASNINTIGTYHEIRTDSASNVYGLEFDGSCDTHSFGTMTIGLGSGATGIMTPDSQNCYALTFKHVAISCLGASAGRTLVHVGYKHRWLRIDFLEADTANNDEANAITVDAAAQSYYIRVCSPVGTWPAMSNLYTLGQFDNGVPQAYTVTLADQIAAAPFEIPPNGAIIAFTCNTTGYSGICYCRSSAVSPFCESLGGDTANLAFGEGAMAAGGGTAGKLNIHANTDGNLWVSNRSGSTLALTFKVLAGIN